MSLFLCCDCGGSKTAVAIADAAGVVVARAHGGPSNFAYLGLDNFVAAVTAAVEGALLSIPSGTPGTAQPPTLPAKTPLFYAAWFGVSGVDSPAAVARLAPALGALLSLPPHPPRLLIANDTALLAAPLAFVSATDPNVRTCVAVVAGTGSIAASFRMPDDAHAEEGARGGAPQELARIGGWGWILGDEGGGFHVGREAVRHLLRAHELVILRSSSSSLYEDAGTNPDSLCARILTFFGVASVPELLPLLHDPDPDAAVSSLENGDALPAHRLLVREKRLSQLAPLVFSAAFGDLDSERKEKGSGDPLALGVLLATSAALAEQVALLLSPPSSSPSSPDASPSFAIPASSSLLVFGGSLVGVPAYRSLVLSALRALGHEFAHVEHVADAAEAGARALVAQFASSRLE